MAASAYSRLCFRGAREVIPFINSADMWTLLRQVFCAGTGERRLIVAYWSDPDAVGHLRGPGSESWAAELRNLDFSLGREFLEPAIEQRTEKGRPRRELGPWPGAGRGA